MVSACLFFLGVVLVDFLGDLSCCFTRSIAALAALREGRALDVGMLTGVIRMIVNSGIGSNVAV